MYMQRILARQSVCVLNCYKGKKDTPGKGNDTVHPIGKHYENTGDTCMKQKVLNSGKIIE